MTAEQLCLIFPSRGGRRPGAGRKPGPFASTVPHRSRASLSPRTPVHVTVKLRRGLPRLRDQLVFARLRGLFAWARSTAFRIVHWSVQVDHLHLVVEASDARELSRAMARFNARLARLVNRLAGRSGAVLRERFHARQLRTPREVHHAVRYVLNNAYKHGVLRSALDPMSSGPMFDGWFGLATAPSERDATVSLPRTWLLRIGWRRHGLLQMPQARHPSGVSRPIIS